MRGSRSPPRGGGVWARDYTYIYIRTAASACVQMAKPRGSPSGVGRTVIGSGTLCFINVLLCYSFSPDNFTNLICSVVSPLCPMLNRAFTTVLTEEGH